MPRFLTAAEVGTGGAMTLPGHMFTSPEVFQLEQQRIFGERWICAGREHQIPEVGDFFVRNVSSESIILVRDENQQVQGLYNVCRHRGTRLCSEREGQFAKRIQCPYHAWNYALDGRLMGAPSMEGCEGFDKESFPLRKVALRIWEGFIYISLAAHPQPFEEAFAPVLTWFSRYNLANLQRARRVEYDVNANWKLIFENYSECYHCPSMHPALVQLSPADSGENDLIAGAFLGGFMTVPRAGGSMTMSGRACSRPVDDSLPVEDLQRVYYYTIFPNVLLSLHHDYVMVHTIWPQAPDRTHIECEWHFHPDAATGGRFDPDDAVDFWDITNRQDWHMCELNQLGVASRAYEPAPYSPRESITAAFDREVLIALGMNG